MLEACDLRAIREIFDIKFAEQDKKIEERLAEQDRSWEEKLDKRFAEQDRSWEEKLDKRFAEQDRRWEEKLDKRFAEQDRRWEEKLDKCFAEQDRRWEKKLDKRFAEQDRSWEEKLDKRFAEQDKKWEAQLHESENLLLEELYRTRDYLETKIDKIEKDLEELKEYYRIDRIEKEGTGLIVQNVRKLEGRVMRLEQKVFA